jgi:glycosyltransferase involved in cell wall biosynthesis
VTVSVVIPSYNHAHFIGEALRSVQRQQIAPERVVVVDDGSTDDTEARVRLFKNEMPQLKYVRQENAGPACARNEGLRHVASEWVVFLDADNLLDRRYIAWTLRAATFPRRNKLALVYTPAIDVSETGSTSIGPTSAWDPYTLRAWNYIDMVSLIRREALTDVGGFEPRLSRLGLEDWNLYLTFAESGWRGRCLPVPLFYYRNHGGPRMNSDTSEAVELINALRPSRAGLPERRRPAEIWARSRRAAVKAVRPVGTRLAG